MSRQSRRLNWSSEKCQSLSSIHSTNINELITVNCLINKYLLSTSTVLGPRSSRSMLTWRLCSGGKGLLHKMWWRSNILSLYCDFSFPQPTSFHPHTPLCPFRAGVPFYWHYSWWLWLHMQFFLLIEETTVLQIKVFGEEMLCFILPCFV